MATVINLVKYDLQTVKKHSASVWKKRKPSGFRKLLIPTLFQFKAWGILLELASSLEQDHATTVNVLTLYVAVKNKPFSHPQRLERSKVRKELVCDGDERKVGRKKIKRGLRTGTRTSLWATSVHTGGTTSDLRNFPPFAKIRGKLPAPRKTQLSDSQRLSTPWPQATRKCLFVCLVANRTFGPA